jgi:hypothetical protein
MFTKSLEKGDVFRVKKIVQAERHDSVGTGYRLSGNRSRLEVPKLSRNWHRPDDLEDHT